MESNLETFGMFLISGDITDPNQTIPLYYNKATKKYFTDINQSIKQFETEIRMKISADNLPQLEANINSSIQKIFGIRDKNAFNRKFDYRRTLEFQRKYRPGTNNTIVQDLKKLSVEK
jgi:hypothetical protein